jgi:hypothetical protein
MHTKQKIEFLKQARNPKNFKNLVQEIALETIQHIEDHGDISLFTMLVDILSKPQQKALVSWGVNHAKLSYDLFAETIKFDREKNTRLEAGAAKPWFDYLPKHHQTKPREFEKSVHSLLRAFEKSDAELTEEQQALILALYDAFNFEG